MAKKKNKNNPTINIEVDINTEGAGPPADPNVPDLPTPKINVHVSNANANTNANANAVGGGGGGVDANKSLHLHHDHNHHHSHYARSVDRDTAGGQKVVERKETVDVDETGSGTKTKTKTVKETSTTPPTKVPTIKAITSIGNPTSINPPSSPAKSVKSLSLPTAPQHPDIVVNISLPQQPPQPAPAPPLPAPTARPPSIAPATVPLPISVPPSPVGSDRSLASTKGRSSRAKTVVPVPLPMPITEEDEVEEEIIVTKTTRKIRKTPSPPLAAPVPLPPPPAPAYLSPGTPLVIADPNWKPEPDPRPLIPSRPGSIMAGEKEKGHGFVETTVVETVTHPPKEKSSFLDKFKLPKFIKPTDTGPGGTPENHIQVRIHQGGDVDVDVGNVGPSGDKKVPIGLRANEPTGTKAGIRPIPISESRTIDG